jgi:pyrroloquinoline quinone biosynthesis protein D
MAILANNAVMSLSKDATMRSVGDGAVLLMVKSGQLYSCNETARDFIGRLDGVRDFEVLVKEISQEYDVTPQTLTDDLSELLEYLLDEGVLISTR